MSLETKKKLTKNTCYWVFDDTGQQIRETQEQRGWEGIAKKQ